MIFSTAAAMTSVSAVNVSVISATKKLRLFKNNFTPLRTSLLSDFSEADFTGYAEITADFITYSFDAVLALAQASMSCVFQPTGDTTGNIIYGWYTTDDPATDWDCAERFDTPVSMAGPNDLLEFFAKFYLSPSLP